MAKENRLLEWLYKSSPLLESQIVSSGMSKALNALLLHGWADMTAHPTVKDRKTGGATAAVFITDKGRKVVDTNAPQAGDAG